MYNPLFTGKVLLELNEVDSTNNYARFWISNNKPIEGTVIIAHNQFSGKGQFGKSWVSEAKKNLTCSIIYYPTHLIAENAFILVQISSLAICKTLNHFNIPNPKIKWPNDILINEEKISGVLIENSIRNNKFQDSIIGIGVNINQTNFNDLLHVTSVKSQLNLEVSIREFSEILFSNLEILYLQSKNLDKFRNTIHEEYNQKLFRKNQVTDLAYADNSVFTGTILSVLPNGNLLVQEGSTTREFIHGEVRILI